MERDHVDAEAVPLRDSDGNALSRQRDSAVVDGEAATGGGGEGRRADDEGAGSGGAASFQWPTVDGVLGAQQEEAMKLARKFFYAGFFLLPWLWFVNCFYFWPVLRSRHSDPLTRFYVVWSGVGCLSVTVLLLSWSLTFSLGAESVFGDAWKHLVVYNVADKYSMAWSQ